MILDILDRAEDYFHYGEKFEKAFEFLCHPNLSQLPEGKYPIDGEEVFAIVSKEKGRREEKALLEIHKKYIDIQAVLQGTDTMGWKPKGECKQPAGEFDTEKDICFYSDKPDSKIAVKPGAFVIFFPEDAHMPSISEDILHKVIIKISVE